MVEIRYNNINPFGNYPPLFSRQRSQEGGSGGDLYYIDTFVLTGQLVVDSCMTFEEKYVYVRNLVVSFSENFKKFEIVDGSNVFYSYDTATVESITFDRDKYINLIPYTITIKCYLGDFASQGVLDPVDNYSYDDSDGCLVRVTHTVSARGINTSESALTNVRNFINSRKDYNPTYLPVGYTVSSPILIEEKENSSGINAEITLERVYVYDKSGLAVSYGNNGMFLKQTIEQGIENGFFTFSVKGYIQANLGTSMSTLRSGLQMIKDSSDLNAAYYYNIYNPGGEISLLNFSFSEEIDDNKITYTINYSDSIGGDPYIIDKTSISISSKNRCVESTLVIRSNYGCVSEKIRKNKIYLESLDIYSYILDKWNTYGDGQPIGNSLNNQSIQFDNLTGDITISGGLCSDLLTNCSCIENFSYSLSGEESLNQYSESLSYRGEGCTYIQDLNYVNRAKFTISGSFLKKKCCEENVAINELYLLVNLLMAKHFIASDIILENGVINTQTNSNYSFTFTWGGDRPSVL